MRPVRSQTPSQVPPPETSLPAKTSWSASLQRCGGRVGLRLRRRLHLVQRQRRQQ